MTINNSLAARMKFGTYLLTYALTEQMPYARAENPMRTTYHMLSFTQQYSATAGRSSFVTTISNSYTYSLMSGSEFNTLTYQMMHSLQEDITFTPAVMWHVAGASTYMQIPTVTQAHPGYLTETGNTIAIKKAFQFAYTVRYTRDQISAPSIRGSANMTATVYKGLKLILRGNVSSAISEGIYGSYLNINATV